MSNDHIENDILIKGDPNIVSKYQQILENEFGLFGSIVVNEGPGWASVGCIFDDDYRQYNDLKTFAKNLLQQLNKSRASQRIFDRHDPAKLEYHWYYIFGSEIDKQLNGISGHYSMVRNFFDNRC